MWRTVLLLAAVLLAGNVFAQDEPPGAVPEIADRQDAAADEPDRDEKERVVTAAVSLLALVAFAGLCLLGLVIFWGYRTRRIARSPLPAAKPLDPFWYLRPKKQTPSEDDEPSP